MQFKYVSLAATASERSTGVAGEGVGSPGCPASCNAPNGQCWQQHCLCSPGYEGLDCANEVRCSGNTHNPAPAPTPAPTPAAAPALPLPLTLTLTLTLPLSPTLTLTP